MGVYHGDYTQVSYLVDLDSRPWSLDYWLCDLGQAALSFSASAPHLLNKRKKKKKEEGHTYFIGYSDDSMKPNIKNT